MFPYYLKASLFALLLAAAFWLIEVLVHVYYFKTNAFLAELWPKDENERWMRLVITFMFLFIGFGAAYYYRQKIKFSTEMQLAHLAINVMGQGMMITDANNNIIFVNPRFTEITGYSLEEVRGEDPRIASSGRQNEAFYTRLWDCLKAHKFWEGEIWNRRKSGELFPEWISISTVEDAQEKILFYVAVFTDITSKKEADEKMKHYAYYDPLTGLANRHFFNETLNRALLQGKRQKKNLGVLFLDLDEFKPVNDTYGHSVGDKLLIEVGQRLTQVLREGDFLARLGGDEFIILLASIEAKKNTKDVAERCVSILEQPFQIEQVEVRIGVSIGGAFSDEVDNQSQELISLADKRMYQAKQAGRNQYNLLD